MVEGFFSFLRLMWEFLSPLGEHSDFFCSSNIYIIDITTDFLARTFHHHMHELRHNGISITVTL